MSQPSEQAMLEFREPNRWQRPIAMAIGLPVVAVFCAIIIALYDIAQRSLGSIGWKFVLALAAILFLFSIATIVIACGLWFAFGTRVVSIDPTSRKVTVAWRALFFTLWRHELSFNDVYEVRCGAKGYGGFGGGPRYIAVWLRVGEQDIDVTRAMRSKTESLEAAQKIAEIMQRPCGWKTEVSAR